MGFSQFHCRESVTRAAEIQTAHAGRCDRANRKATGALPDVNVTTPDGSLVIQSDLVLGCDGRHSIIRDAAKLTVEDIGAPIDVLWFRITRDPKDTDHVFARLQPGRMLVTLDRGDYWQCAYVIPKGGILTRSRPVALISFAAMSPSLRQIWRLT